MRRLIRDSNVVRSNGAPVFVVVVAMTVSIGKAFTLNFVVVEESSLTCCLRKLEALNRRLTKLEHMQRLTTGEKRGEQ